MATTKTTTKKTASVKPTETPVEIKEKVETTPTPASTTVAVDADELIKSILNNVNAKSSDSKNYIMCRSVTIGGLNINCKSGNVYEFTDYGADCEIEYHDLAALVRKHSAHIFEPRIVIEDEEFLDEFPQIKKAYDNMYTAEDLDQLFELPPTQMINTIKTLPKNVASGLKNVITTRIANGQIDSMRTIKALADYYDCDFNLISELFGK